MERLANIHPGEILLEEFLKPMGMTQQQLARQIRVPFQRINELVNRRRGVTPATALRLSRLFGNTPDSWMNLQIRWDLYRAQKKESEILKRIEPLENRGAL